MAENILIKTGLLFSLIILLTMGFFTSPLTFAQSTDDLEKERLQLEKERRIYDETFQNLQQQITSLTNTLNQLQNSGVDSYKLEEIEEQLDELREDLSDLQETEPALLEREKSYKEKSPSSHDIASEETEPASIPSWFKNNAKWWKEGLISDGDIINALESLIIQDVIPLDKFVKTSPGLEHGAGVPPGGTFILTHDEPKIPSYQKDVFGFWSDGKVSDSEIVNSIGHLMNQGIINSEKIQTEILQRQIEKYEETDEWEDPSLWTDGLTPMTDSDEREDPRGENKLSNLYDARIAIFFPNNLSDEFKDCSLSDCYDDIDIEILECNKSSCSNLIRISEPVEPIDGGMQQLTQVTVLNLDGIQFPIAQFALWKWTGECDDAWHYHTPTSQAIAIDGETGIIDPDQENCGFGKVGEVFVGTSFMSQSQIDTFRDRADSDPLENKAMTGGSDDETTPVDVNPGPVSIEESDDSPFTMSKTVTSPYGIDFVDSDGDGISDKIDDEPNKKSTKFGTNGSGLPGEIIDSGDLTVSIIGNEDFGTLLIEVGTDGDSKFVIIQVMGVELEFEAGTIVDLSFG